MKNIKIKEMSLSNFKGQNAHHVFGETNKVSGFNGSGKSTIIKAWNWLMCGQCDANSVANADLYDNRKPITPDTPSAIVEAVIDIDGTEYTLKRSATASFSRKRGTSETVKNASDNYSYFIDNVSYNATEYRNWLSVNIASDDMLKYVLSGDYFVNLCFSDKRKARQIIEKTVGTVERSEMKGNYADIDELLQKMTPDQIEEQSKNLSKSIDDRLNEIPTVISQKEAEISDIKQTDFKAVKDEIAALEREHESIEEKIFDYSARMKPLLEAKSNAEHDKQMKQAVYDKAKKVYMQGLIDEDNNLCLEISRIEKENAEKHEKISYYMRMNATDEKRIAEREKELDGLRAKRDEFKSDVYDAVTVCPTCGRPLTEEMIEQNREEFEAQRRKLIERVVEQGKEISACIENVRNTINKRNEGIRYIVIEDVEPLKQKLNELRTNDNVVPFEMTEQGKTLQADIDAVVIPEVKMPEDSELKQRVADIKERLKVLYKKDGLQVRISSLEKDVDELRIEQREKGAELAMYERRRLLVKEYKQEQMEILSHKVNDGLKSSYIECWSQQKDGQSIPDIVLKNADGVNFATSNGASRIVTTCDIQMFFCEKLGVSMPMFIDESSIIQTSNLPHYDGVQTFYLFCSDEPLKIETK